MHFYRRWLDLHIFSQLRVGLVWGLELVEMHVAVYIFGLSTLRIIDAQFAQFLSMPLQSGTTLSSWNQYKREQYISSLTLHVTVIRR